MAMTATQYPSLVSLSPERGGRWSESSGAGCCLGGLGFDVSGVSVSSEAARCQSSVVGLRVGVPTPVWGALPIFGGDTCCGDLLCKGALKEFTELGRDALVAFLVLAGGTDVCWFAGPVGEVP